MKKILILLLTLNCFVFANSLYNSTYDRDIEKAVNKYWGYSMPLNWNWWKAQIYQESLFDSNAISPVGAQGLSQFMPNTKTQIWKELGFSNSISAFVPYYSINAGAYYMKKLFNQWTSKRPLEDKLFLAQASYNAGLGNILKAQKVCNMAVLYEDIIKCLPQVTGHHANETITYTKRIKQWYGLLK